MAMGKTSKQVMAKAETIWQRHAHPIGNWSGILIVPFLALAVWGRIWFGCWALIPLILTLIWIWLNVRIFLVPKRKNNWMSKGMMGEHVWDARKTIPIPPQHAKMVALLNSFLGIGFIPFAMGFYQLDVWMVITSTATTATVKLWFLDRLAWLFDDMNETHITYGKWLR